MVHILQGSYNIEQADALKGELLALLRSGETDLQVDLSGLQSMDLSCVQVLLAFFQEARKENIKADLINPSKEILDFFFMCGLFNSCSWVDGFNLSDVLLV